MISVDDAGVPIITNACEQAELDRLRPLVPSALTRLERATDLELTDTSAAREGNTLTQVETNLVIEHGITIAGKRLKDHLEAIDHHDTLHCVRELAQARSPLAQFDIRNPHALVMQRSDPEIAGRYATATLREAALRGVAMIDLAFPKENQCCFDSQV